MVSTVNVEPETVDKLTSHAARQLVIRLEITEQDTSYEPFRVEIVAMGLVRCGFNHPRFGIFQYVSAYSPHEAKLQLYEDKVIEEAHLDDQRNLRQRILETLNYWADTRPSWVSPDRELALFRERDDHSRHVPARSAFLIQYYARMHEMMSRYAWTPSRHAHLASDFESKLCGLIRRANADLRSAGVFLG